MLADQKPLPPPKTRTIYKNPLLYSSLLMGIALLVVGWILFSRWRENLSIERRTREERSQKQLENDRVALEQFGGKDLAIQSFYASPGAIHKGDSAQLCYGVANAKSVKLEPQPNALSDSSGNTKTQSLKLNIK